MILQKVLMALFAGAALITTAPACSHDDDDDEWEEDRREREKRKHRRHDSRYQYYYGQPPIVIYGDPPPTPRLHHGGPAVPPSHRPALKGHQAFPKESPADRTAAKDRQREILEKEFAAEQALLAEAQKKLAGRLAKGPSDEPAHEAPEELQTYKDSVEAHERNVEALKRELRNLNR